MFQKYSILREELPIGYFSLVSFSAFFLLLFRFKQCIFCKFVSFFWHFGFKILSAVNSSKTTSVISSLEEGLLADLDL